MVISVHADSNPFFKMAMYRSNFQGTLEDGTDTLLRNVDSDATLTSQKIEDLNSTAAKA
jgi:hypothetical protein